MQIVNVGDPITWGKTCIAAGDLEPLDSALSHVMNDGLMDRDQLARWWIAFWYIYDIGAASYVSERTGVEFWDTLYAAAINDKPSPIGGMWPRGAERRRWRAAAATNSVNQLRKMFGVPIDVINYVYQNTGFAETRKRAMELPQFGLWASFDVVYTGLCHFGWKGEIPADYRVFFTVPQQGALEAATYWGTTPDLALWRVMEGMRDVPVPPGNITRRYCGAGEAETIFCKWMHATHGTYWIGKDTMSMHNTLGRWGCVSPTAVKLHERLPPLPGLEEAAE